MWTLLPAPGHPRQAPALRVRHLGLLSLPTLWSEVQEARRVERTHGEMHEQVHRCIADWKRDKLGSILGPAGAHHVHPFHPHHLGHLEPGLHAIPALWTLSSAFYLVSSAWTRKQGASYKLLHIANKFRCAFDYQISNRDKSFFRCTVLSSSEFIKLNYGANRCKPIIYVNAGNNNDVQLWSVVLWEVFQSNTNK